ncbi:MAG: nucleoside-diphosphate kinase [Flavobacteriales bacterium AspAUS03]
MLRNFTLTIIKPDAVKKGYIGPILNKTTSAGFGIRALKMITFTKKEAQRFYEVHQKCSFFETMITFMSSSPIVVAVLEKENAVEDFRTLIGATNPEEAAQGTIRRIYAESIEKNAIHGADSDENALKEIKFHFTKKEIFSF